jgi:hypothetical protein
MHRRTFLRLSAGGVLTVFGCASLTTAHRTPRAAGYRRQLGLATWADIRDHVGDMMMRHQYVPLRLEGPPAIYIESEWRQREPFDDEKTTGIEQSRTRLIVTGRLSSTKVSALGDLYDLDLLVENQSRRAEGDWGEGGATAEFTRYATRIADDLETGFRSIVRRF